MSELTETAMKEYNFTVIFRDPSKGHSVHVAHMMKQNQMTGWTTITNSYSGAVYIYQNDDIAAIYKQPITENSIRAIKQPV